MQPRRVRPRRRCFTKTAAVGGLAAVKDGAAALVNSCTPRPVLGDINAAVLESCAQAPEVCAHEIFFVVVAGASSTQRLQSGLRAGCARTRDRPRTCVRIYWLS
jgi:hypothetical protein